MLLAIFSQLGEHVTAKEYDEKEIAIAQKIGKKTCTESICYKLLGGISNVNREYATDVKAKEYQEKALEIAQEIGDREQEAICYARILAVRCWWSMIMNMSRLKNFKKKHLESPKKSVIGNKKQDATHA